MIKLNPSATITDEFAEKIRNDNKNEKIMRYAPIMVLVLLVIVFSFACGTSFIGPGNLLNILNQMALPLVVALGLTFVIMIGSIDLSIDGLVGMSGSLFACLVLNSEFAGRDMGFFGAVIAVALGAVVGQLIGLCHVYLKIPSFMASFAFQYICKGIGMLSYQGHPPTILDATIKALPTTYFLKIPFITWVAIILFLVCFFIQEYTAFGRHIYAVGTNESIHAPSASASKRSRSASSPWPVRSPPWPASSVRSALARARSPSATARCSPRRRLSSSAARRWPAARAASRTRSSAS